MAFKNKRIIYCCLESVQAVKLTIMLKRLIYTILDDKEFIRIW